MAKKFDEVQERTVTIQRKTKTLSFRPMIEEADLNHFMELVKGKVAMNLYDFTGGKGDNAFNICYNFDLPDVSYLYHHACIGSLPIPYQATKFLGAYPEKEGAYKGYAKNTRITIRRDAFIADKVTGEKKIAQHPWIINLEFGYAKPSKNDMGMYFPAKGTYKKMHAGFIALTDIEFLNCFEKTVMYIREFQHIVSPELIRKGFAALEKQKERGTYTGDDSSDQVSENDTDTSDEKMETRSFNVLLLKLNFSEEGVVTAIGKIRDKQYQMILDSFGEQEREAYKNKEPITLKTYVKDGILHCI